MKDYKRTINYLITHDRNVPALSDVQLSALEAVERLPERSADGKGEVQVPIIRDVWDVYSSFVPRNLIADYLNWILATNLARRVRHSRKVVTTQTLNKEYHAMKSRAVKARWDKYRARKAEEEAAEAARIAENPDAEAAETRRCAKPMRHVTLHVTRDVVTAYRKFGTTWTRRCAFSEFVLKCLAQYEFMGKKLLPIQEDAVRKPMKGRVYLTPEAKAAVVEYFQKHKKEFNCAGSVLVAITRENVK